MSHEISILANGTAEAAYRVKPAWHGLGQVLDANQSLDTWIDAAGMRWTAERAPVQFQAAGNAEISEWSDNIVIHRSDDGRPLGLVSKNYKIVQPAEIMEFFRDLISLNNFEMEAAGCLRNGQRFWALARTGDGIKIAGNDLIKPYTLLSTSVDGTLATEARFTSVRVVCQNTLSAAMRNDRQAIKVSHRSHFNADSVKREMGLMADGFTQHAATLEKLAQFKVTSEQATLILAGIIDSKAVNLQTGAANGERIDEVRQSKPWQSMMSLFSGGGRGSMLESSRGTAFGLLQAVTEHYDHHARAHSNENRFISGQYGAGAKAKTDALQQLADLVNA